MSPLSAQVVLRRGSFKLFRSSIAWLRSAVSIELSSFAHSACLSGRQVGKFALHHDCSPLSNSHPRLFGGIGALSAFASAQICPIFLLRPTSNHTDCAQKSFGMTSKAGCLVFGFSYALAHAFLACLAIASWPAEVA
jgi:hypothetical protein